jgi:Holliday junction resolvasome RuvABC DNA-binding subunit
MISQEIKLPRLEDLSTLSGLPEGIMASDMVTDLKKDLQRLGKSEKESAEITRKLAEAFEDERNRAVEACYLAGYLKGMADMSQRFKHLLETREIVGHPEGGK